MESVEVTLVVIFLSEAKVISKSASVFNTVTRPFKYDLRTRNKKCSRTHGVLEEAKLSLSLSLLHLADVGIWFPDQGWLTFPWPSSTVNDIRLNSEGKYYSQWASSLKVSG